jgi:hypothetical protein
MVSISYLNNLIFWRIIMLKIKHFLLALSFIPLSLTALQLPVYPQSPSKGTAGFQSGNGTGGNLTFTTSTQGNVSTIVLITQAEILAAIDGLSGLGVLGSLSASDAKAKIDLLFSSSAGLGTTVVKLNPTSTTDGLVSYTDTSGATRDVIYPIIPDGLTSTQVLALVTLGASIGATNDQIKAAVNIAATGASPTATYKMLLSVAALFATVKTSNSETDFNISSAAGQSQDTSLKLKSFAQGLLVAQSKSVSVDSGALAAAIDSYNDLLSGSTPATVSKLSDNKPFMKVGGALRSMRSAFN